MAHRVIDIRHRVWEAAIRKEYPPGDSEADYLCEVAARVAPMFPGGLVEILEGLALLARLTIDTVTFDDGFVINDMMRDINKTIGSRQALTVVAALDALGRPEQWWDAQRFTRPESAAEEERVYRDIQQRIRALPGVVRVD